MIVVDNKNYNRKEIIDNRKDDAVLGGDKNKNKTWSGGIFVLGSPLSNKNDVQCATM